MTQERIIQADIMLAARQAPGVRVFRNNTGAALDRAGRLIHFGLCEGSSDLIGWQSLVVTPDMVGQTLARFLAWEVKNETGRPTPKQQAFLDAVRRAGGIAALVRSTDEALSSVV